MAKLNLKSETAQKRTACGANPADGLLFLSINSPSIVLTVLIPAASLFSTETCAKNCLTALSTLVLNLDDQVHCGYQSVQL